MTHKTCKRCGNARGVENFHKCTATRDGLQRWCIDCMNERKSERCNRMPETGRKICKGCGHNKAIWEYGRRASASDGLNYVCRPCARDYHRNYRREGKAQ